MVFKVEVFGQSYAVDDGDGHAITIDGRPLTRLSDEPGVKARYALETEILAKYAAARTSAQVAFMSMLRRQMCGPDTPTSDPSFDSDPDDGGD